MGRGPWDVPWTSLQKSWMIHQCIHHCTPPCHTYICRWLHFSFSWDLGPSEPSGGFWWLYLLWNTPAPPWLLHTFLKLSLSPLWYGTIMWGFWMMLVPGLFWLLLFFFLVGFLDFILILLRDHAGYLYLDRTVYRWSSSCFNSWGLEQMVSALCSRVPITLYLDGNVWWLSHCRYRSVCVGFLKTVLLRLPSSLGVTNTSRKGMDPSSLYSSQVNWICWSIGLMWSRKALFLWWL